MPKRPLRASTRFAKQTPDGLRLRVLSAIPNWEKIPRGARQALALMPVYGTFLEACDSMGKKSYAADWLKIDTVSNISAKWQVDGTYPEHSSIRMRRVRGEKRKEVEERKPLTQAEILQQLANELAAVALIKAESSLSGAGAAKLAADSGWFLNLEAEVEKERAYTDQRIAESMEMRAKRKLIPATKEELGEEVPLFEQDEEVDGNFSGETAAAAEKSN